jgi:hypothetical protein
MTRNRVEAPLELHPSALCINGVVPLSSATFKFKERNEERLWVLQHCPGIEYGIFRKRRSRTACTTVMLLIGN